MKLWTSLTVTAFGSQITNLALPLTAAVMLHATPWQMGVLVALETLPFALVSLHAGVLIDRVRKLPIVIVSDIGRGLALLAIPIAAWFDVLSMEILFASASSAACRTSSAAPPTRCCSRSSRDGSGWSRPTRR